MLDTPLSDALALRATASAFDSHRGKLPVPGDHHRSPEAIAVSRQISELGALIAKLGDEVLSLVTGRERTPHTTRVIAEFAAAVQPAGEAASALGTVAHQLAFLARTDHVRDQPDARDAREAAVQIVAESLQTADAALYDAANSLYAASVTISPPLVERLQAARSRSTTPVPAPGPPPPGVGPAATVLPDHVRRGR
ncbi:hypothetical protein ACWEFL_20625 [Streptomyces sp. NPDC004838]